MKLLRLCLLLVAGCTSALAQEPQWLVQARAREGTLGALHAVSSADQQISFSVPVPLVGKVTEDKESYSASFALGPGAVAECELMKDDFDVASMLRATARITFADVIERAQGPIEKRGVEAIEAGVAGRTPYLSVSWLYRVKDAQGPKLGALRQYAASTGDIGVYCAFTGLGYAKTLQAVVRALLESLQFKAAEPAPYFSEVSLATIANLRVGYAQVELRRDKDGDTRLVQKSALLIARAADAVQSHDTVRVEWIHPDGQLINANYVSGVNGEIDEDLSLTGGEGENWLVKGKFKGKDIEETVASGTPSTWIAETRLRQALLAKAHPVGEKATLSAWVGADPGRFTERTAKVLSELDANTFSVQETDGALSVDLNVDRATGQVKQALAQLGPTTVRFDRVYVQGAL